MVGTLRGEDFTLVLTRNFSALAVPPRYYIRSGHPRLQMPGVRNSVMLQVHQTRLSLFIDLGSIRQPNPPAEKYTGTILACLPPDQRLPQYIPTILHPLLYTVQSTGRKLNPIQRRGISMAGKLRSVVVYQRRQNLPVLLYKTMT